MVCLCFNLTSPKGQVSLCNHLVSVRLFVVRRKVSHLNHSPLKPLNSIWLGQSLCGTLSKLCPTVSHTIQDGCYCKTQKIPPLSTAVFIINQNEFTFYLLLYGNESFNIYQRFFYEIFLSADLYRFTKIRHILTKVHI